MIINYCLTFLTAIPLLVGLSIIPKYWGALEAKHLSGSILSMFLLWTLITLTVFQFLNSDSNSRLSGKNMIYKYLFYIALFSLGTLLLGLISALISLVTHSLLTHIFSKDIINGTSVFLFIIFLIGFLGVFSRIPTRA